MKTDKVTKVLLAVIAVNLTLLTIVNLNLVPIAHANEKDLNYEVVSSKNYGLVPLNEDGTISVKIINSEELDVNITGISTFDELDVNIEEIGGGHVSHGGPIAVQVE